MGERREELRNVEGACCGMETQFPGFGYERGQDNTGVDRCVLLNPAALPRVQYIIFQAVELQSRRNNLGEEFANGVQKADGAKGLRDIVSRFVRLGNDDTS